MVRAVLGVGHCEGKWTLSNSVFKDTGICYVGFKNTSTIIATALHGSKRHLYHQRPWNEAKVSVVGCITWVTVLMFIYSLLKYILKEIPEPFCQVLMDDRAPKEQFTNLHSHCTTWDWNQTQHKWWASKSAQNKELHLHKRSPHLTDRRSYAFQKQRFLSPPSKILIHWVQFNRPFSPYMTNSFWKGLCSVPGS